MRVRAKYGFSGVPGGFSAPGASGVPVAAVGGVSLKIRLSSIVAGCLDLSGRGCCFRPVLTVRPPSSRLHKTGAAVAVAVGGCRGRGVVAPSGRLLSLLLAPSVGLSVGAVGLLPIGLRRRGVRYLNIVLCK